MLGKDQAQADPDPSNLTLTQELSPLGQPRLQVPMQPISLPVNPWVEVAMVAFKHVQQFCDTLSFKTQTLFLSP